MRRPIFVTIILFLLALGLLFLGVASVSGQVNASAGDARAVFGILGMPIVVGLKQAGHKRLEFAWGSLVILAAPFVLGQLSAMRHLIRRGSAVT